MMSCTYWKESHCMTLSQFVEYHEGGYPQPFIVDRYQTSSRNTGYELQEGQIAIACHERKVRVLEANVLLEDGRRCPVTIPINLAIHFALLPGENSETFCGHPKLLVKDIVHTKGGLPMAVRVLNACKNTKKQQVPPNEVLFNVTKSGKHTFTATSANGVQHTFHERDSTAQFSSRLGDNKVYPVKFFDHITFPQKARVYLTEGQECQVEGLEHLCVVEFARRHEQHFLAIMTNIDDPESRDCQAVPLDSDILVSAVTLKGYPLENLTPQSRKMIKQRSTENIHQPSSGNFYLSYPIDTTIRDEPDPAPLCNPAPPGSRRESQISIGRSQSTFSVNMEIHYYNWPPESSDQEVSSPHPRRASFGVKLIPSGCRSEKCLPTCVEAAEYTYAFTGLPTQVRSGGPPPSTPPPTSPHYAKPKHRMSLPTQPSPVLPHSQQPDTVHEDDYEEMNAPVEDNSMQQEKVQQGWGQAQPQTWSPPPVVPAPSDHSPKPKPKPKGVPSTAVPLDSPGPTRPHPPPVSKKPIMLTSRPMEPELRYHVADKLGHDWRKVCTYLGLQHYQLDQADVARAKLENKAMEALVMWLRGQGDSSAPRSWETLLQALRLAGHNDMASEVERGIKNGKLAVVVAK